MPILRASSIFVLLLLTSGFGGRPADVLIAVDDTRPSTVSRLVNAGVNVVNVVDSYLLIIAEQNDVARLHRSGVDYTVLGRTATGKSFYIMALPKLDRLDHVRSKVRPLKSGASTLVFQASSERAHAIAGQGYDIARLFNRPIRLPSETRPPPPSRSPADGTIARMVASVSGERIDEQVQRLQDFGSRFSLHDSCAAAGRFIQREFGDLGLDSVFVHNFRDKYNGNVVAVKRGIREPRRIIVIGGHYDSVNWDFDDCPGADDNASGTACVLECARALSPYAFERTIVFVAFCGEEQGLLGSEAFAADAASRGDEIVAMVCVDMIGYLAADDTEDMDVISNDSSEWLRDRTIDVAATYVPELPAVKGSLRPFAASDHVSFWNNGYDAILFHEDSDQSSPYLHTSDDVVGVSYVAPSLASGSTRVAVALVADLAGPVEPATAPLSIRPVTLGPFRPPTVVHNGQPKGPTWTVILHGHDDLDVRRIDERTLRIGNAAPVRIRYRDAAMGSRDTDSCSGVAQPPDGIEDLIADFPGGDVLATLGDAADRGETLMIQVTGELRDGTPLDCRGCVTVNGPSGPPSVATAEATPKRLALYPAAPNPFNPSTSIAYDVPVDGAFVSLGVFDIRGRRVRLLVHGPKARGHYETRWMGNDDSGRPVASGVYVCRLRSGDVSQTRKVVLLR